MPRSGFNAFRMAEYLPVLWVSSSNGHGTKPWANFSLRGRSVTPEKLPRSGTELVFNNMVFTDSWGLLAITTSTISNFSSFKRTLGRDAPWTRGTEVSDEQAVSFEHWGVSIIFWDGAEIFVGASSTLFSATSATKQRKVSPVPYILTATHVKNYRLPPGPPGPSEGSPLLLSCPNCELRVWLKRHLRKDAWLGSV